MPDSFDQNTAYPLRRLVDRVPSMLAYWDRDLRCRFANRAYEQWFGVEDRGLIGTRLQDLLGGMLYRLNEAHIQAALAGDEQRFERDVPGPGGRVRHSLAHYIPDHVDGKVAGFLVQVTETTQLEQAQASLQCEQALRRQLETQAQALHGLLQERDEMLKVLAHEVRQPLNTASAALQSAFTALAGVGNLDVPYSVRCAQTVLAQVQDSVDNTLAAATLLARSGPLARHDADIDALIQLAIADLPSGERKRVVVDRVTTTRTASMDTSLLRLALRNLLSNALRHSPAGSPVWIRLDDSDVPLALLIDVCDAGRGIPASLVPRLFERGGRHRASGDASGNGLGLYIVRRVMELHGGRVELARNASDGATLRLVVAQGVGE